MATSAMLAAAWHDDLLEEAARDVTREMFGLCMERDVRFEGRRIRCQDLDQGPHKGNHRGNREAIPVRLT